MQIQPYLFFDGNCEEAVEFYRQALGAETIMMLRFRDSPDPGMAPPGEENKIMHARLRIGDSIVLASDAPCLEQAKLQGFALSLTAADEAEADRMFTALADRGEVRMAMAKTFFSPRFGMVTDRFGVPWMVYVAP